MILTRTLTTPVIPHLHTSSTPSQVTPTSAHGTKGGTDRVRPAKVAKAAKAAAAGAPPPPGTKASGWGDDLSYQQWDMHQISVPRAYEHNYRGQGIKVRAVSLA